MVATIVKQIKDDLELHRLVPPVNVEVFARSLGVTRIKRSSIKASGMLIAGKSGYSMLLNEEHSWKRQRFSCAHEIGHLLLKKLGLANPGVSEARFQSPSSARKIEETICDQIAAEILLPELHFTKDAEGSNWSLESIDQLVRKYQASAESVAIRLVKLMPNASILGVWRPTSIRKMRMKLEKVISNTARYKLPNHVNPATFWFLRRALLGEGLEHGSSAVIDLYPHPALKEIPAEAIGLYPPSFRRVMALYFPEPKDPL